MAAKRKGRRNRTPDKLTPEVQKVVVDGVAAGMPRKHAAERAGVAERTARQWFHRGAREKSGVYHAFFAAMKKAEAERLAASVARIGRAAQGGQVVERTTRTVTTRKADGTETTTTTTTEKVAPGQWTADAWFLERRHPDEFAGNRGEVRQLREKLSALLKAIDDGRLHVAHEAGGPGDPAGGAVAEVPPGI